MGYKKQLKIWALFPALLILFILISEFFAEKLGWCVLKAQGRFNYFDCLPFVRNDFIENFGILSLAILLSLLPLFFLKEAVYLAWKKFAVWALPIMAILIALTPARAPGAYLSLGIDREWMTIATSIVFLSISYLLIAIASFRKKK